jgi:hypothetical protein
MGLAQFINENIDPILVEWEAFAKSLPPGQTMTSTALRDDAERMLRFVAADMEASQSEAQRAVKGRGRQVVGSDDTAAQAHGRLRLTQAFDLVQMVSEFRARASRERHSVVVRSNGGGRTVSVVRVDPFQRGNRPDSRRIGKSVRQ